MSRWDFRNYHSGTSETFPGALARAEKTLFAHAQDLLQICSVTLSSVRHADWKRHALTTTICVDDNIYTILVSISQEALV